MLQIGVDYDRSITNAVIETRGDGRVLPVVPAEPDSSNVWVRQHQRLYMSPGVIVGTIIHDDDLDVVRGLERTGANLSNRRNEASALPERRHDDGQFCSTLAHSGTSVWLTACWSRSWLAT